MDIQLSLNELTTLVSRFQSSVYILEQSKDYPEKRSDGNILRKLINMKRLATKQGAVSIS